MIVAIQKKYNLISEMSWEMLYNHTSGIFYFL